MSAVNGAETNEWTYEWIAQDAHYGQRPSYELFSPGKL